MCCSEVLCQHQAWRLQSLTWFLSKCLLGNCEFHCLSVEYVISLKWGWYVTRPCPLMMLGHWHNADSQIRYDLQILFVSIITDCVYKVHFNRSYSIFISKWHPTECCGISNVYGGTICMALQPLSVTCVQEGPLLYEPVWDGGLMHHLSATLMVWSHHSMVCFLQNTK